MRYLADSTLATWHNLTSPCILWCHMNRTLHFHNRPPHLEAQSNHEQTSDKPNLSEIQQNTWLLAFKSVKTMKGEKRQRHCHSSGQTDKETWGINRIGHLSLDSGKEEECQYKSWGTLSRVCDLVSIFMPCHCLSFDKCATAHLIND